MFRLALALLLAMVPFGAGANQLSVWPNGSDEGQCEPDSPCATIGRACSVANSSADRETSIAVTGGVYRHNTSCNIRYHRLVVIYGDCNNHPDILLFGKDKAFSAEDSAILAVNCVEPISKSPEEDNEAGELNKAQEILGMVLPADENSALPLDPSEEALNEPAAHIAG